MNNISILNPSISIVRPFINKREVNIRKTFAIFTLFIILSLLVFSIIQINAYTKEIYLLQNYENKLNQINQENKLLEVSFSQANSLKRVGGYAELQTFEKSEKTEYIRVLESYGMAN
jgi:predicted PurR-regulated permease PerM